MKEGICGARVSCNETWLLLKNLRSEQKALVEIHRLSVLVPLAWHFVVIRQIDIIRFVSNLPSVAAFWKPQVSIVPDYDHSIELSLRDLIRVIPLQIVTVK